MSAHKPPPDIARMLDDLPIVIRADEHVPLPLGIAFVPMPHAYQEPHPAGRTLPGHDLDAESSS